MSGLVAIDAVTVVCVKHYFLSFLLRYIFPEWAAHRKGAMIISLFFTVDTLPNVGNGFTVCMFLRGTQGAYFILLRLRA